MDEAGVEEFEGYIGIERIVLFLEFGLNPCASSALSTRSFFLKCMFSFLEPLEIGLRSAGVCGISFASCVLFSS